MQLDYQKQAKTKLIAGIVAIMVIAGIVLVTDHLKAESQETASSLPTTTTSQTSDTTSTNSTTAASDTSTYKDGTYSASSSYYVPHGSETITVSLTIKNGVVSSSSIDNSEGDPESARFQEDFAASYKSYVVGQKVGSVQLNRISGASDTTQGFNDALSQIASQAQA